MNKKIIPVALTAMVMAVLAGCAKKDDPSSSIQPTSGTSETSATSGATSASPTSASSQTTSSSQPTSQTSTPTSATSQSTSSSRPTSQTSTTSQMTSSSSISPTTGSSSEIPPVPSEPVYAYVLRNGDPVNLIEGKGLGGEDQLEAHDLAMNNGDTIYFVNVTPNPVEPLTSLRIEGDTCGFANVSGALTANHDGVYSFYLQLLGYENNVVYITEAISYTVTSEEWNAAMGVDTIYGIDSNFALNITFTQVEATMNYSFVVEDNKMQETDERGDVEYYEVTQEKQYRYEQENSLWVKKEFTENPKTFIGMFLEFLGEYTNFRYVEEEHNYVCDSLTTEMGEFRNIKVCFENKQLMSWSADLSQGEDTGSLQATVTHGGQSVELPTIVELNATLKGTFDDWGDGKKMDPNPDNPTEVVIHDFHATENTKVKVYLGNEKWNETYKNVEGSSIFNHHVVIDGEGNAEFLVDGIFDIYYNFVEGDQHGVYIQTKEFDNPYEILTTATGLEAKSVARFNKVDVSGTTFVEYVCENIGSQVDYTYSLLKNSSPVTFTLEEGGESANFTQSGNGFTYHGEALNLDAYIKVYAPDNIQVYFAVSIVKPVYAYILNTNEPVELTDGFDTEGKPQFEALKVEVAENDRIYFANIATATPEPLSGLTIGDEKTCGFTCVDGVLTASVAGTYNFYLKPQYENDKVYIAEYVDEAIRLMGSFDGWSEGVVMEPNGSSTTEFVARDFKVAAGDEFRIRDGATWKENYKTSGGNNNAIEKNLCYVDTDKNNVVFRVSGVFAFYYDKGETNPGIYIDTIDVSCAYQGKVQYEAGHIDETGWFAFNKIELGEKGFVEYKIIDVPSGNGFLYTFLKNFDVVTEITFETESGEGSKFAPSGDGFLYSGSASSLDFYLKESLDDHSVSVYIGIHQEIIYDVTVKIETDQQPWVLKDVDIFVGAIDADEKTTWIPVSYTDCAANFEVSLPEGTVKFLVVRCVKGTTTPNWDMKSGDEPGRIYNQTDPDTFLEKGVSEYEVHFVDYPRPVKF